MKQIFFKDGVVEREFTQLDSRIYTPIEYMSQMAWLMSEDFLVVTSIKREDSSTHSQKMPYRFIDFAILYHGGIVITEGLRGVVNKRFVYDKKRPKLDTIPELRHGDAPHMHLQIKPRGV